MLGIIILIFSLINLDIIKYSFFYSLIELNLTFIPNLFIAYLISNLLLSSKLLNYLFHKLNKFFKFENQISLMISFFSVIFSSLTTASIINKLYNDKKLDYLEACYLLKYNLYINPLFIISLFKFEGLIIILFNIISNIIISLFNKPKILLNNLYIEYKFNLINFINEFVSISLQTIYLIALFNIFINISKNYINLSFIYPLIEISNIKNINNLLISFYIPFNGLVIFLCLKNTLNKDFKIFKIIYYRLISSIITFILYYIYYIIKKSLI